VIKRSKYSTTDRFHAEPQSFCRKFNDSEQTVYIALGSNQGDSTANLIQARSFLQEISTSPIRASQVYQTEPIGPSDTDFLNAVICIDWKGSPDALLDRLKEQERIQGRPSRYPKWTSRTLDLDIIDFGGLTLKYDYLQLPHPGIAERLFVLLPLYDLAPEWSDPVTKKNISELINTAPKMRIELGAWQWE
tara:strand:+ start:98 stop:670 length:573 start_codon:yes stop_codon:yes gene_type:complete